MFPHLELQNVLDLYQIPYRRNHFHNSAYDAYYTLQAFITICSRVASEDESHPFFQDVVFVCLDTEGKLDLEPLGLGVITLLSFYIHRLLFYIYKKYAIPKGAQDWSPQAKGTSIHYRNAQELWSNCH